MSIQREEITIKEFISGTTLVFFSTHLTANTTITSRDPSIEYAPSFVTYNNFNIPTAMFTFDGQNLWNRDGNNIYQPLSATSNNFITGHSYVQKVEQILNSTIINNIENEFSQSIIDSIGTAVTTSPVNHVFSGYSEVDDFYVNIKINRTTATLDTLNVYNNLVNSMPTQEAETGVLFGKLMALQSIKDEEGNRIRIPLRNVPIGLFNTSEDYPTSSSVSDNGDRIFLNNIEGSKQDEYFNAESFNLDKDVLLRSVSEFTTVPDQYKYITSTNEEGEFVIYNAPLGTQIVMFEVDLLKQGLTRDEIALNFFPFPPDEDAIIDQIPNFSFKQFPIDVVPAWGTIQTGYTELNVTVNMDLRKWTTYFIPPVSLGGSKLEASVAQSAANSLKVNVRNMAKEGYPNTQIKLTEIPNDLDRVIGQQLNWHQEFAQVKDKGEFYKFGTSIIKLPANIYDPNAYRTDSDGVPMQRPSQKGVWLSSYQLKIFIGDYAGRQTGNYREHDNVHYYSHYDLNHTTNNITNQNATFESGVGQFPYEKPWTAEYPNQYKIPQKPTQERFISNSTNGRTETAPGNGLYWLQEPSFSDGDMVGNLVNGESGGFGHQPVLGQSVSNRIAFSITKDYMYKYEIGVSENEEYANGYQPSNPNFADFAGVSTVVNGEKYQRLESGYGYFLRPQGWPRVGRHTWGGGGEMLWEPDTRPGGSQASTPGPGVTGLGYHSGLWSGPAYNVDTYNIDLLDIALSLDRNSRYKKTGGMEFFRVIDSSSKNLAIPSSFVVPTGAILNFQNLGDNSALTCILVNEGEIDAKISDPRLIYLNGVTSLTIPPGGTIPLWNFSSGVPGNPFWNGAALNLPGNKSFNTTTNRYDASCYRLVILLGFGITNPSYPQVRHISGCLNALVYPWNNPPAQNWLVTAQSHTDSGDNLCAGVNRCDGTAGDTGRMYGIGVVSTPTQSNSVTGHW